WARMRLRNCVISSREGASPACRATPSRTAVSVTMRSMRARSSAAWRRWRFAAWLDNTSLLIMMTSPRRMRRLAEELLAVLLLSALLLALALARPFVAEVPERVDLGLRRAQLGD